MLLNLSESGLAGGAGLLMGVRVNAVQVVQLDFIQVIGPVVSNIGGGRVELYNFFMSLCVKHLS